MSEYRRGLLLGLLAYGIWGFFPVYFHALDRSAPLEVLGHRIVWSFVVSMGLLLILRKRHLLMRALREARTRNFLTLASLFIALNWGVYVYAVHENHVLDASLGYYINPLVTVMLGVLVLGERLRPLQWAALAIAAVAVLLLTLNQTQFPWIALSLAFSFGLYSLCKKQVGTTVDSVTGLTIETLILLIPGAAFLIWLELTQRSTFTATPWQPWLLLSAGPVTAGVLMIFAAATARIPLTSIGLMQYITPTVQLLLGVLVLGEHLTTGRLISFGLIWIALAVFTWDLFRTMRRAAPVAPEPPVG